MEAASPCRPRTVFLDGIVRAVETRLHVGPHLPLKEEGRPQSTRQGPLTAVSELSVMGDAEERNRTSRPIIGSANTQTVSSRLGCKDAYPLGGLVPLGKSSGGNDGKTVPPGNPRRLPQQITVLVVIAVRLVSAWTKPVLKRVSSVPVLSVPGVVQVLAVVCGLAYRLGEKLA